MRLPTLRQVEAVAVELALRWAHTRGLVPEPWSKIGRAARRRFREEAKSMLIRALNAGPPRAT